MCFWSGRGTSAFSAWLQGRLIDHLRNTQSVGLEDLQALVLDEADRLLQMGFAEEVFPSPHGLVSAPLTKKPLAWHHMRALRQQCYP